MKIINPTQFGTGAAFTWTREYLLEYLATGKNAVLHTPQYIAAFKAIDRADFVPQDQLKMAYADQEIDIGYGETLTRPSTLARMIELLQPRSGGQYLDIGSGTGYFATILAAVAGKEGLVISLERLQWLWEMARTAQTRYKDIFGLTFLYRDGMDGYPEKAPFDGIHVSFALETIPTTWTDQLKTNGGILVAPTVHKDIRVIERQGDDYTEEIVPGFVFEQGKRGKG